MKQESLFCLFSGSPAAVVLASRSGTFLSANRPGGELLASLPGECGDSASVPGHPLEQALANSEDYKGLVAGETAAAVFSLAVQGQGGAARWFNIDAWAIDESEGLDPPVEEKDARFVLIIRDETWKRQEETRLQEARRNAEQAMEAKSRFLANMSHEIRTPIQTILGMIELLQDTNLDREQSEYSRQVKFSAEVLLSLINDILDYSKIEAGKMTLERIDFDLEQTIEQAVEMITLEAHKKGLEIALDIPPDAALIIKGDPNKYRQILINLVKNAVKFTREGGIIITAALSEWKGQEAIRVSVADTGIGVPEEIRDQLFTTFFQGDPSNTRQFGGTGLGLAISRNLVELMHGTINMLPNDGGGSIFRFTIPIERSGLSGEAASAALLRRDLRILVVDDRPESRRILVSYFQDIGYFEVDVAVSGEEALTAMRAAAARKRPFDICFLDMIMPWMDGWRLAAEINKDEQISRARLILMVPQGLLGAEAKMTLLRWFKAYINKPVTRKDLIRTMGEVLAGFTEEPEAVEELEAIDEAEASGRETARPGGVEEEGEKPLILVVEDHPVNRKLFSTILEKLEYPVILADDGLEALEKAAAYPVSFIFMDIQMPRMNGYDAADQLRQRGFGKPIIAVTASAFPDERERCMNVGFNDILLKPFKRQDVEEILLAWPPGKNLSAPAPAAGLSRTEAVLPPKPAPPQEELPVSGDMIFNPAEVNETFLGEEELIRSLLIRFIDRTREQIRTDIPRCMEAGDWEEARREAHTMKGSALTLAARELGQTAARLEAAFKNRDYGGMSSVFPLLDAAFTRFETEAGQYLNETPGPGKEP